ncbi:MAG: hypothetical protein WC558_04630 [Patulibacter sp.]
MSPIRRISLAATAAMAVLALAIPTSASAISINGGTYDVMGGVTYFGMASASANADIGVVCYHYLGPGIGYGWGLATGQASTRFVPPFQATDSAWGGNCDLEDDTDIGAAQVHVGGALMLTLTGLKPGQNPLSPQRAYNGTLGLNANSSIRFQLAKFPGCTVSVAGPQTVDLSSGGEITVNDTNDTIMLDLYDTEFAATKTASCPSRIGDSVTIMQPGFGWWFQGVTVTP